ncbi:MAG: hypothetical protein GX057_07630 [Clostridiales bacterium]|nr:hypothetical protein [Clostridiales bacterium]
MINLVFGVSGSGKSAYIEEQITADVAAGREAYLIVPEQQTYVAERRYTKILPPSAQLCFEVLNFTRLANKIFREYGGLSYNYIDTGMKSLLMWNNLRELAPILEEYGRPASSPADAARLAPLMLSAAGELKAAAVSPAELEVAAKKLPEASALRARLLDISLIVASYQNLVTQSYDDASDDLTKAAELLNEHDFFSGKHVYIDSFTSYTAQEYAIIKQIFRQADSVTITIGCEGPESRQIHFATLRDTAKRLCRLAAERGRCNIVKLGEPKRFSSPELALLEKYLWRMDCPEIPESEAVPAKNIRIFSCRNRYSEAEAAAAAILTELRRGMRCRDIAVIMRDAGAWAGIVDAVFDKFGIPYFLSERTDLSSKPLVKLILSAFRIKTRNWRQSDVISYLKTGLCGIDEREADIFEDYCTTWNINGRSFLEERWSMNPDGYVTELSERGAEILRIANSVKNRLVPPLVSLFTSLDAADDLRGMCRALYEYTEALDIRTRLFELAERERAAGNLRCAGETLRLYDIYINALEKISSALPDIKLDCEEFACALKLVFDNTDIGSLPTRQDEVIIGSASLLRVDSPRFVIALGMNEGEFPAEVGDSGVFSGTDRLLLAKLGIQLSGDPALRASDELFFVYRTLTAASELLMITYSEASPSGSRRQPSQVIARLQALFADLAVTEYDSTDLLFRLQTPETAVEYLKSLGDSPEAAALRASLEKLDGMAPRLAALKTPLSDSECRISPSSAAQLFGDIALSQTRLESYVLCPFGYFCNYVLDLRESGKAEFSYNNAGSFIHYVMERFMREALRGGKLNTELTDAEIAALSDQIIEEYAGRIIPDNTERGSRLEYLFFRLRRITLVLISNIREEFRHSLFTPAFFELKLDGSDPTFPEPAEFRGPDGERVRIRGVVDRVDLFRRGDDVFIRVVDYKTGEKVYSPDDLKEGLGLQLLLYLFALCRNPSQEFRRALGCPPGGKIYPAGALYLSANLPLVTVDDDLSEEQILKMALAQIKRSGPLCSDDGILAAMNDNFDPRFLGGAKKDSKGIIKGNNLLDIDEFYSLYDSIAETISRITAEMRSGRASAAPKIHRGDSPCDLCRFGAVCRSAKPSGRKKK